MLIRVSEFLVLFLTSAHAQQAVTTVGSFRLPAGERGFFGAAAFRNEPPTFRLTAKSAGARSGNLWIRSTDSGLLLAGKVDGPEPEWAMGEDSKIFSGARQVTVWKTIVTRNAAMRKM